MTAMITAHSFGETAYELISFFDYYDDDINSEADEKTDSSVRDADGTSAQQDILYHLLTVAYGYLVFSSISYGGYIFFSSFINLEDGFTCDLQKDSISQATYAGAFPIIVSFTNREECKAGIGEVFSYFDINKDGFIDRCED